jgi:hypothetical protein
MRRKDRGRHQAARNRSPLRAFRELGEMGEVHAAANRSVQVVRYPTQVALASPARNPASRFGYGRASADPISAEASVYLLSNQTNS